MSARRFNGDLSFTKRDRSRDEGIEGMKTQDAAMKVMEVIWPTRAGIGVTCAPHVALLAICEALNAARQQGAADESAAHGQTMDQAVAEWRGRAEKAEADMDRALDGAAEAEWDAALGQLAAMRDCVQSLMGALANFELAEGPCKWNDEAEGQEVRDAQKLLSAPAPAVASYEARLKAEAYREAAAMFMRARRDCPAGQTFDIVDLFERAAFTIERAADQTDKHKEGT